MDFYMCKKQNMPQWILNFEKETKTLWPAGEVVHHKKQEKKNQNVQKIVKENDKNKTYDTARDVSTHGEGNGRFSSASRSGSGLKRETGEEGRGGRETELPRVPLYYPINPYVWSTTSCHCDPISVYLTLTLLCSWVCLCQLCRCLLDSKLQFEFHDCFSSPVVRRPPPRCPTSSFLELSLHSRSWAKISQETAEGLKNAFPKGSSITNSRHGTICHLCPTWHHQWKKPLFFILIISSSDRRTTCPLGFHSCCPVHAGISSQKKDESL